MLVAIAALLPVAWIPVQPAASARAAWAGCRGVDITPNSNIQQVIDRHPKGTTFCFRKGTYRLTQPIRPKSKDKLIGQRGAVLNGSKRLTSWDHRDGRWIASNQRQQVPVSNEDCKRSEYTGCRYAEQVFLDDRPLWQVMSLSDLKPGAFYFDHGADKIYIKNDPRRRKVEASVAPAGVVGYGGYQDGVLVKGFRIEKFANPPTGHVAAVQPGNGWTIQGNEIRLNHRLGVFANNRTVIRGNRIHHNGMAGIKGQGDRVRVINNRISANNIAGFSHGFSAGLRVTSTRDLIVRGNSVIANDGPGLKTDTNNVNTLYEDNRVIGNAAPGISHEKSYAAMITGNYLRNNNRKARGLALGYGGNITLHSSSNVKIFRNHVVSTIDVNGISLIDSDRGSGILGRFETSNVVVKNNLVRMVAGAETGLVGRRDAAVYASWGNRFQGNIYYLGQPRGKHFQWKGSSLTRTGWRSVGNDRDGTYRAWRR